MEERRRNLDLKSEREFYLGKLRDIEVLLQARDSDNDVLKILYASESARVST